MLLSVAESWCVFAFEHNFLFRVGSWQHAVHAVHSMTALALLQNVISYNSPFAAMKTSLPCQCDVGWGFRQGTEGSIAAYGRGGHCKLAAMLLRQMMEALRAAMGRMCVGISRLVCQLHALDTGRLVYDPIFSATTA